MILYLSILVVTIFTPLLSTHILKKIKNLILNTRKIIKNTKQSKNIFSLSLLKIIYILFCINLSLYAYIPYIKTSSIMIKSIIFSAFLILFGIHKIETFPTQFKRILMLFYLFVTFFIIEQTGPVATSLSWLNTTNTILLFIILIGSILHFYHNKLTYLLRFWTVNDLLYLTLFFLCLLLNNTPINKPVLFPSSLFLIKLCPTYILLKMIYNTHYRDENNRRLNNLA